MRIKLKLNNLSCPDCAKKIEKKVQALSCVSLAELNLSSGELFLTVNDGDNGGCVSDVKKIVKKIEPSVTVSGENDKEESALPKTELIRLVLSVLLFILSYLFRSFETVSLIFILSCYAVSAYPVIINAVRSIKDKNGFDENVLMTIATLGALIIGEYSEAAAVVLLYQIGELFQSLAAERSRKSISGLMDLRPDSANVKRDGNIICVPPEDVETGEIIVVKAGEKIPIDGIIVSGTSSLDTSALTGESIPADVKENDEVLSGSVNLSGILDIKTTKPFGESTVSKILELTENARKSKAPTEAFITKFSGIYTPIVVIAAFLTALIPPLLFGGSFSEWIYRALTFLVVSCPCALVISVPLAYFAGMGGASRKGILIKGGNVIDKIAECNAYIFDKTGTLTSGDFEIAEIAPVGMNDSQLLELCAIAEANSNHPVAACIKDEYRKINSSFATVGIASEEIPGMGIKAEKDGRTILCGNLRLISTAGISPEKTSDGTVLYCAVNGTYAGYIRISDKIKAGASEAVRELKVLTSAEIYLFSGDKEDIVRKTSEEAGIDIYKAELLPAEKLEYAEELIHDGKRIAFVGDGINDAPVISRADIGIAMGGVGSDAAIEAADIVIMDDDPQKIPLAYKICSRTKSIVIQNIIFAIGIKVIVLVLAALGIADMWLAVIADTGVSVIAVINSVRALQTGFTQER